MLREGDIIIQAVLGGKSLGYEYTEDVLTATIFGTLRYLKPDKALIPFIENAFLYDDKRTTLWKRLNSEGIDLRCYREMEYVFWPSNPTYGEPDLILRFSNHIHGYEDILLVVEAKFKSGKSGIEENDQLARYFDAVSKDIENFSDPYVSNFKGKKGYIIYLTEAEASAAISASCKIINSRYERVYNNIFHLKWHNLYKVFEEMQPFLSDYEMIIARDIMKYLEKLGLRDFSGISLPDESLNAMISSPDTAFYNNCNSDLDTEFFFILENISLHYEKNIFYEED